MGRGSEIGEAMDDNLDSIFAVMLIAVILYAISLKENKNVRTNFESRSSHYDHTAAY